MNSVLDSPLAFDYVSFGLINVVNSLWTWLAVVTATVSFWRLRPRAIEGLKLHLPSSNDVVRSSNGCSPFPETSPPPVTAEEELPRSVSAPPSRAHAAVPSSSSGLGRFEDDGGVTKGVKFTLYFDEDTNGDVGGEGEGDGDVTARETEESGGENWWESCLRMRTEEKSWYRYQDLTVFNGNVVRLWDDNQGCRVN
ncbi:PREDICTED: uncharacterized protein LOC101305000 [Fragaria vesca subsp. vesca]|uniref:uncharacterized protein LOC101305000 n=1 Tax=Fragaria vesca subsp. vesca TaxID=101020 RepID=UPI0002C34F4C|nr:PREDICTED: uncharacterized protein LOC101305000 [Fragaria vesca subsp. vesca]